MSGSVSRWMVGLGLCIPALAQGLMTEGSAQALRPIKEMRGNCDHEDLPGCPARKSGEEWQPVAKRRQIPSWFTKAPPGRAGFFTMR